MIVGDWHSDIHEQPVFESLSRLGNDVRGFPWHHYFQTDTTKSALSVGVKKAQYKYQIGPLVSELNNELVSEIMDFVPDLIFFYRGTHILKRTLKRAKKLLPNVILVGYNNDDPFSEAYPFWMWRHYKACLRYYDIVFAYRERNLSELEGAGASAAFLLRSWFNPDVHYPETVEAGETPSFSSDVVFVGHFENDGRLEVLESLAAQGISVKIYGPPYEWDKVLLASSSLRSLAPVRLVWGEDYRRAISSSKIALCFFSKLNRDTYTRRCFEIPACKTVLCSEYSSEMAELFQDNREALLFRDTDELIRKVNEVLADEKKRESIAKLGCERVWADGHDITSRMKYMIDEVRSHVSSVNE